MDIAQAVIVATQSPGVEPWPDLGLGARQLAPVANKPVLFHHLDALASAGVREVTVLTDGTTSASIRAAVGDGSSWGMSVCHADALHAAKGGAFAGTGPVIVQHSDVLLREPITDLGVPFADDMVDVLVLRPRSGAEHLPPIQQAAATGYVIGTDVQHRLSRSPLTVDDAVAGLRAAGARFKVREVAAFLPCRGSATQLLEVNRQLLDDMAPCEPGAGERVFGSQIQGRVALHPSAEVRDSLIRGPVAIGPGATIANAYIGPYTSIGPNVTIDSVEIEHSIVFAGAQIRYLHARLEGSLVGPGAQISRDFRVPQAMRLSIGERAQIVLA